MQANDEAIDRLIAKLEAGRRGGPPAPPLNPPGGGGTSDDMEGRVGKLEAHVETLRADTGTLKKDVGEIRVDIGILKEKVTHLPTKGFIVTSTTTGIGLLSALIIFGEKIKASLGL